nr:hypothetical protein [uncultured Dubosiella sp.]
MPCSPPRINPYLRLYKTKRKRAAIEIAFARRWASVLMTQLLVL